MARLNLLDVAKLNGCDAVVGLIEETLELAPEVAAFPAIVKKGTSYRTKVRTGLPTAAFRNGNQGTAASKSTFTNRLVQAFIISGRIEVDKAVAAADEDGEASLQAMEGAGVMESALRTIGKQIFYGSLNDAKGFPGLNDLVDSSMIVSAGSSTAKSAVYAVSFGAQNCSLVFGGGTPFTLSPWRDGDGTDESGLKFPATIADLTCWVGLQAASKFGVGKISALGSDAANGAWTKGLTDKLVAELLSGWKGGSPSVLFMNRRSAYQLQCSRSVVLYSAGASVGGAAMPFAPAPTESNGIPIVVTDQIGNADA
jgi:hypothetical protein